MKLKTQFEFDAAHRLVGYDGKCNQLHGHIWKVELEIKGNKLDDVGILWDFTNAKLLKDLFDHKTILKDCSENFVLIQTIKNTCGDDSTYLMKENPTAENLCFEILNNLKKYRSELYYKIKVWESPKSYAELEG